MTRKTSGTVRGTKQGPINGMLKPNAGLQCDLPTQASMPMLNKGPGSAVRGGLLARGGGRAWIREGRGGCLSGHCLTLPSPPVMVWLGWDEVSSRQRRIIFPPTMYTFIWVFQNNDSEEGRSCSTEAGGKASWWGSCSAENRASAGSSGPAAGSVGPGIRQRGTEGSGEMVRRVTCGVFSKGDGWVSKMSYLRDE